MWCTRWYIPLLILPFSGASPLFLIAFIGSVTLQAQPCLYCVVLLLALAQGSCYWQPIPTQSLLTNPSHLNSSLPPIEIGSRIRLVDRCWCDLSMTGFFDPFNNTRWEALSIQGEKHRLTKVKVQGEVAEAIPEPSLAEVKGVAGEPKVDAAADIQSTSDRSPSAYSVFQTVSETHAAISDRVRSWFEIKPSPPTDDTLTGSSDDLSSIPTPSKTETFPMLSPALDVQMSTNPISLPINSAPAAAPKEFLPIFRRRYDLREHGVGLVLDFGWGRKS